MPSATDMRDAYKIIVLEDAKRDAARASSSAAAAEDCRAEARDAPDDAADLREEMQLSGASAVEEAAERLEAAQALTTAPPYPFEPQTADPRMRSFNRVTYYEEKAKVTRTRRDAAEAASHVPNDHAAVRSLAQWQLAVLIADRLWALAQKYLQQLTMVTAHARAPFTAVIGLAAPQGEAVRPAKAASG